MKNKVLLGVGFSLLVLVVGLFFFDVVSMSSVGGFSPLSVSRASFERNGVWGDSWLFTVSSLPNAFTVKGSISSSELASDTGVTPVSNFDLQLSLDQSLRYPISNSGVGLFDYSFKVSPKYYCLSSNDDGGYVDGSEFVAYTYKYTGVQCVTVKVYRSQHGTVGVLSASPSIPTKVSVVLSGDGKSTSTTVIDTASGSLSKDLLFGGKSIGRVDYVGDLKLSAQPVPELFQSYKPINKDGVWFFTSINAFNVYSGLNSGDVKTNMQSCIGQLSDPFKDTVSCVSKYQNAYNNLVESSPKFLTQVYSDGKSNIYAEFKDPEKLFVVPVLSFVVDADFIGFKVNSGIPKIDSASAGACASGSVGSVSVKVSNVGSGLGAFDTSLACPKFSVETSTISDNFAPGSSKTQKFSFDTNTDVKVSDSCTVTVVDKGSLKSVSKSVTASCSPAVICVPNSEQCDGIVKKVCSSDGTSLSVKSGDTSCINSPVKNDSSQICSALLGGLVPSQLGVKDDCGFFCKLGLAKSDVVNVCVYDWSLVIILAVLIIVGLIVLLIVRGGKKKGGNAKIVKILVILGVVGLLIFWLWAFILWLIIGLIVLILVDKFLLNGLLMRIIVK